MAWGGLAGPQPEQSHPRYLVQVPGTRYRVPGNSSRVFLNEFPQAMCSKLRRLGGIKRPSTTYNRAISSTLIAGLSHKSLRSEGMPNSSRG